MMVTRLDNVDKIIAEFETFSMTAPANYHVDRVHMPFLRTGLPGSNRSPSNRSAK
jgi:hypothetical protein